MVLITVLVICFVIQQIVIVHLAKPYDAYLALSGYGMKSGHIWELLTCQFFHHGYLHLFLNLAGLWYFGRAIEADLGRRGFWLIYLGALFAGALLQGLVALTGYLLPESLESTAALVRDRFGGPVAGSSIGVCGLLAAFCRSRPEQRIRLFFLLPIKAAHLLWVALAVAVALIFVPSAPPDVAHLAHLGGLLAGIILIKWARKPPQPVSAPQAV
jgi:membrane associated rhomboid family serine protease